MICEDKWHIRSKNWFIFKTIGLFIVVNSFLAKVLYANQWRIDSWWDFTQQWIILPCFLIVYLKHQAFNIFKQIFYNTIGTICINYGYIFVSWIIVSLVGIENMKNQYYVYLYKDIGNQMIWLTIAYCILIALKAIVVVIIYFPKRKHELIAEFQEIELQSIKKLRQNSIQNNASINTQLSNANNLNTTNTSINVQSPETMVETKKSSKLELIAKEQELIKENIAKEINKLEKLEKERVLCFLSVNFFAKSFLYEKTWLFPNIFSVLYRIIMLLLSLMYMVTGYIHMMNWDKDMNPVYEDSRRLFERIYFASTLLFALLYPIFAILITFEKLYKKEW